MRTGAKPEGGSGCGLKGSRFCRCMARQSFGNRGCEHRNGAQCNRSQAKKRSAEAETLNENAAHGGT